MKKILKVTVNVLSWVLLIIALAVTLLVFSSEKNNGVANLFGYIPMTVETDSMEPTFSSSDLIFCKEIDDLFKLENDDVITYWTIIDGKRVKNTHRIVKVNEFEGTRSFITRGDANKVDDNYTVYAGDLIGKWTKVRIPGFGAIMAFLRTRVGFFVCILIPMILFFLFEVYKLIATIIEVKKPAVSEELEEEIKKKAIEEYLAQQKKEQEEKQNGEQPEIKDEEKKKDERKDTTNEEKKEDNQPEIKAEDKKEEEHPEITDKEKQKDEQSEIPDEEKPKDMQPETAGDEKQESEQP